MSINESVLSIINTRLRSIFLVPLVIVLGGCTSVSNLFDYGTNDNSELVTQPDSKDTSSNLDQNSLSDDKDSESGLIKYLLPSEKKTIKTKPIAAATDSEEFASVPPLWEVNVGGGASYYEEFSARDAVDDVISLTYPVGVSVTGTTALVPAFYNDAIYAASSAGNITRFDPVTGDEVWSIDTKHRLSGGVGVSEGIILVGTFKGEILAYDVNGKQLWESRVTSEVLSPPQVDQGVVVVRTGEGRIFGLDAVDGKRKWVYQGSIPSLTVRSYAGVLVKGGGVFAGFPGGKLVAIKLSNGKVGWEVFVSKPRGATELERITDVTSLPVVDDQQICAVAYKGRVSCFDVMTGNPIWTRDISSSAGLTMDNRYVYVSDDGGSVVAYDKNNGTVIWKKKIPKREVKRFANLSWIDPSGERGKTVENQYTGDESNYWDFLKDLDWDKDDNPEDDWEKSDRPDIRGGGSGFLGKYITNITGGDVGARAIINKLSAPFVYGSQVVVGDSQGFVTVLKNDDGSIVSQSETDGGAILTRPKHVPNGLVVQTINGGLYTFSMQ